MLPVIRDTSKPFDPEEADQWAGSAETFLMEHMGEDYVIRFRDSAGMAPHFSVGSDALRTKYWGAVHVRVTRLHEFSREFSP